MGEVYRATDTTLDRDVRVSDDACEIGPPESGLTPAHPGVGPGPTCTYLPSIQMLPDRSNRDHLPVARVTTTAAANYLALLGAGAE